MLSPRFTQSLMFSLLAHTLLGIVLLLAVHWSPAKSSKTARQPAHTVKVIEAVAVDSRAVQQAVARLRQAQKLKAQREVERVRHLQRQARVAARQRRQEAARIKALKRARQKMAQQSAADAKRLQALKQQRRQAQQHLAKLNADAAEAAKASAARQRLAAQEAAKAAARKRAQDALKKQLASQLAEEQAQLDAVADKHLQSVVTKYTALIQHSIAQNWQVPPSAKKSMSCRLQLNIAPGGTVIRVTLEKTSGSEVFDRSAVAAVMKASPLPVPTESGAFDKFRVLHLVVRPENIQSNQLG